MKYEICCKGLALDRSTMTGVQGRFEQALDHFDQHTLKLKVVFSDVNGPKGGRDKHCMAQLRLRGSHEVVIEEEGAEILGVAGVTADRLATVVDRTIKKDRQLRRDTTI